LPFEFKDAEVKGIAIWDSYYCNFN